jgi:polyketide synthase 5
VDQQRAIPIAVIGMGCRLPGGIGSPEELWEALLRGDDLVSEIPDERWNLDVYYDPEPGVPGRSSCKWGAFLDDVAGFDSDFFGISEREATATDPQHRLLLETSWEAMEHAGLTPKTLSDSLTGVFMGLSVNDYLLLAADTDAMAGPYGVTGSNFSLASGRISYALGVHGPAITIDTACSSGLLAIHLACRSLNDGESDLALAGGANVMLDARRYAGGSAAGMLSPTGRCHAFDAGADGFVSGEGAAVLLLKRLPDAERDGDRILAVVRGTAANQDGRTETITTPSMDAQTVVYQKALATAAIDPGSIGMIEAHGTGTSVGDPIEFGGLAKVYGIDGACAVGSVKTNLGHTQSAAGAVGLIKAVLAVGHGVVPQSLHFNRLPDDLAAIDTKLFVPQENTPWPTNGNHPRLAAVSSYGMSGTNVHAIVEEAPTTTTHETQEPVDGSALGATLLFPLSSTSPEELRRTSGRLAEWLDSRESGVALPDLAYTLARRRAHRPVRTAVMAGSRDELTQALREVADGDTPYQAAVGRDDRGPVWVFSGQGSQWAAMGAELLSTEPVFAATVAEAEPLIAGEAGFSVTEAISAPGTVTGIDLIQPCIFTMQVALAATMKAYGVQPGAVIGHSMGEAAAAVVAGALSLEDGVRVICRRSRLMATIAGSGAMASVELPAAQVMSELMSRGVSDVVVAVVASPESTVIGGATQSVRDLVAAWEERDVMAREVAVDVASHSPQVDPILDELTDVLAELNPMTPEIPYYSATSFDPREQPMCDAYYWVDNLRHTVRFAAAVQSALEDGYRVFAEMAPHPLLTHAVSQTARGLGMPLAALAAMRREQELPNGLLDFFADLHNAGAAVDFSMLYPGGRLVDAPLPTWTHRPLMLSRAGQDARGQGACTVSAHPLMGPHVLLNEEPERHIWQAEVGIEAQAWLGDHQIHNAAALPGAAYCEMALTAAGTILGEASEVRDINFEQMLLLDDETPVGAVATVESPGVVTFVVDTVQDGEQARRATAVLHAAEEADPPAHDMIALLAEHPCRVEGEQIRHWMAKRGIQFGPAFTGLAAAYTADDSGATVLAEVALPTSIRAHQNGFGVHPALLDACFQSVAAHPSVGQVANGGMLLPLGVRRLRAYGPARSARYCYSRVTEAGAGGIEADLDVLDEHGQVLLIVRGLKMGTGVSQASERDRVLAERLLTVEWESRDLAEVADAHPGAWLLIGTSATADAITTNLADALKATGAQCTSMSWSQHADHQLTTERLREHLATDGIDGVVVVTGPRNGSLDDELAVRGGEYVRHLVRIVRELPEVLGEPRLYLVTSDTQSVLPGEQVNLELAGLRGLMRVIGTEHPQLRATQIDIDSRTEGEQLAQQLLARSDEDETAWRNGQWYTARLSATPLRAEERQTAEVDYGQDGVRLQIRTPGDLESMELVAFERLLPGPGQIEVAVTASSINFADVLIAFGRYPTFEGRLPQLGTDFAGVVTAVGPGVKDHKVGDHVGGLSANGCWGTFVTCDANLAVKLPAGLTDAQAAATTTAHATAWYGLHELARIRRGDRVLIHSATGGVGQAAIAIARGVGAEIFATAGSEQRRQLLRDMGIEHVYDSRSVEFADAIRRDTDGYGVDIVLNSVTGAAQRAGLELLALGGRFVEIGKRDIYGDTKLGLFPFRRNLAFHGVDLGLMSASHPHQVRALLKKVYRLMAQGSLPVPESTHYPLADAATAIRMMGGAQHTGKLVLDIPHAGRTRVVVPPEQARIFRSDGAYIITGGLGGLGLFLAERMASAGCGRIVLTSRSQPNDKALETIHLIRAMGADIVVECGDITAPGTVNRLVAAATATGLPLRGVLHAAAVVEDATLENITDELIQRDWAPKVYGAWNLHRATAAQPLDWFCSFSSAAALVGSPGQGAYAAANSWLDAFTKWRRAQGLPATAIAWGAWAEIGRATALAEAADTAITPEEGAYAFQTLLSHDRAYTGYAPLTGTPWFADLAQRSRFAERFRSTAQGATDTSKLLDELNALPKDEWPTRLRRLISDQVSVILRRTIDPDRPLSEYGLDSLGNLELRTHIKAETGIRVTSTDITTIQDMAGLLCEKLTSPQVASTSA